MSLPAPVYLDHAATTPMRPVAIEAMSAVLGTVGNASSLHGSGRVARRRLEESRGVEADEGSGRAYMLRKRLAQELDEEVRTFAASCADASHERLAAAAVDSRVNPAQSPEMILNGAYLAETEDELRRALDDLGERFGPDGVAYELTGPWPPYNFTGEEPEE